jgi:hypothetical protein
MDRNISRLPKNSLLTVSKSREKLDTQYFQPSPGRYNPIEIILNQLVAVNQATDPERLPGK